MRVNQLANRIKQHEKTFTVSLLDGRFGLRPVRGVNTPKAGF